MENSVKKLFKSGLLHLKIVTDKWKYIQIPNQF